MTVQILQGKRPVIDSEIPVVVRELIELCWDGDPAVRPSMDDIYVGHTTYVYLSETSFLFLQ